MTGPTLYFSQRSYFMGMMLSFSSLTSISVTYVNKITRKKKRVTKAASTDYLAKLVDHEVFGNYRPISNLKIISKIIQKVVALRLQNYLESNQLDEPLL